MSVTTPRGPFWIYRAYNEHGTLLYIGKSNRPSLRYQQHCADKPWVREVARWDVNLAQSYRTEVDVLAAEATAIRTEQPLFNIEHNENNPSRVNPHTMRYAFTGMPYRPVMYEDVRTGQWKPPRSTDQTRTAHPVPCRPKHAAVVVLWALLAIVLWQQLLLSPPAACLVSAIVTAAVMSASKTPRRRYRRRRR